MKGQPAQKAGSPDTFQTPGYAIQPLLPYIRRMHGYNTVWDPACGKGNIVRAFQQEGISAWGSDINIQYPEAIGLNFLRSGWEDLEWNIIVTNPPYSLKDKFIERCVESQQAFALLLPLTALEGQTRQRCWKQLGERLEIMLLDRRINFETPSGKGAGAWFPVAWFTYGLNLTHQLTFAELPKADRKEEREKKKE